MLLLLLLLLLSNFSHVRICVTPEMAAHQALLSLGFSRQEHWSGLPFPSPVHESEKWKGSHSVVSDSSRSHGLQPTRLLCPWDFPGKSTGVGCHCLLQRCMHCFLYSRIPGGILGALHSLTHLTFMTVQVVKYSSCVYCILSYLWQVTYISELQNSQFYSSDTCFRTLC